ncbi:hypothetical protein [Schleiferilactobacillus shenzhenensis]|uniref:Uncharacterized protein n=1 Tax=Schleiferilactobacillus shenzhenensis LY-73 TaxID=1231336 RepID=U4TQX8_9LACO|nr:hypothetical protein [Schleiferilactobacillus shenzhenensis]ERL66639.1 hypothetical protein L248_0318 [Schleiferilactobacillus shenzhenensis LY-73]
MSQKKKKQPNPWFTGAFDDVDFAAMIAKDGTFDDWGTYPGESVDW